MIVRTHRNIHAVHFIGHAIVENVRKNIGIMSAERFVNDSLAFSRAKPRAIRVYKECPLLILPPLMQIPVDIFEKLLAAFHSDDAEVAVIVLLHVKFLSLLF